MLSRKVGTRSAYRFVSLRLARKKVIVIRWDETPMQIRPELNRKQMHTLKTCNDELEIKRDANERMRYDKTLLHF